MYHLYAIVDPPRRPLALPRGVGQGKPFAIAARAGPCAVVCRLDAGAPVATASNVRRHLAVLEALMAAQTVLPARFGTVFDDADGIDRFIEHRRDRFCRDLDRFRGHVEVGLRLAVASGKACGEQGGRAGDADPGALPPSTGPGTAYLLARGRQAAARAATARALNDLADRICPPLAALSTDFVRHVDRRDPDRGLAAAFLVRKDDLAAFRARLSQARRANPQADLLCTGPWPPYSFVAMDGPANASPGVPHG